MEQKQLKTEKGDVAPPSHAGSVPSGDSVKNQLSRPDGDDTPMLNFAVFNSNEGDSGTAGQKFLVATNRVKTMAKDEQEKNSLDSSIRNFLYSNFYRSVEPSPAGGIRIPLGNNDETPLKNVQMEDFLKQPVD